MYLTVCSLRVLFPTVAEYFTGLFLADHTLPTHPEPTWQRMAQSQFNGTTLPVNIEAEGPISNHEHSMTEKTGNQQAMYVCPIYSLIILNAFISVTR